MNNKKILVTGAAGFIGFNLTRKLLKLGHEVVGIDNLNNYYDVELKKNRLNVLRSAKFTFYKIDISNKKILYDVFAEEKPDIVVNLAAQAGVRYSLENPQAYLDSNLQGFLNILECCRKFPVEHLVYASSSSVYGGNKKVPFSTNDNVDHPVSLYAATKKSDELMAHVYSHLFGIPTTGLRFFTVYGPWGRPDMAYFSFTQNIVAGKPIKIFNNGKMKRDFTYIDDIVEGITRVIGNPPVKNENWSAATQGISSSWAPYKIYNIGNNHPVELMKFIEILEQKIGKTAIKEYYGMQPGDVTQTYADIEDLKQSVDFSPSTELGVGIGKFIEWYRKYYRI